MGIDLAKQRILEQVNLADLIGERLELKRRAGRFVGLCPFHEERSPSFTIFDDHYFCFGCRARGDAIDFARQDQGLSFVEALKYLAAKYNIATPELEQGLQDNKKRQQLADLFQILQVSLQYFKQELKSPDGAACLAYLGQRGFDAEAIERFEFGFAPNRPTGLVAHLLRKGFRLEDMIAASVATLAERDRKTYDFYRHRLMIPIRDHYGRIIGFGGRALGDDPAKYKNSRETELFDKGRVLYNFDQAKAAMKVKKRALVVEGYMDALQLRNFGFEETVACLGVALTIHHAKRLSQVCQNIYLIFDSDKAGKRASLKAVEMAIDLPQLRFYVIRLPDKDDPDSYTRREGSAAFEAQIEKAQDLLEYAISTRIQDAHGTAIPSLVAAEFVPWLQSIRDSIHQSYLADRIAQSTGITRDDILQQVRVGASKEDRGTSQGPRLAATEPSPAQAPPIMIRPPNKTEYAFIGHLYFAQADELDLEEAARLVQSQLRDDSIWLELAGDLLRSLRKKQSPADLGPQVWRSASSELVLEILTELHRSRAAFDCTDRMYRLQNLVKNRSAEDLKLTIKSLQRQLAQASKEDQIGILTNIQELYREISLQKG